MSLSRRLFLATAGAGAIGAGASGAAQGASTSVPLMSTYVAGSDRFAAPSLVGALEVGAPLDLKRESDNGYDARAVSIWTRNGDKLGYVPRIHNQPLANLLDAGIAPEAHLSQISGPLSRPDIALSIALTLA